MLCFCPSLKYRVMLVVWQLGWVEIDEWAAGVMAEWAEQVGRLVELENLSQHPVQPASPCNDRRSLGPSSSSSS